MSDLIKCDFCETDTVIRTIETDRIRFRRPNGFTAIEVQVPVYRCQKCGFAYTDGEGERIREEAMASIGPVTQPGEAKQ